MSHDTEFDVAVIGAGISGIVTAKCLLDDKFKIIVYEQTRHIGGLWQFTEDGYGVMSFTHMYVQSDCLMDKMPEVERNRTEQTEQNRHVYLGVLY